MSRDIATASSAGFSFSMRIPFSPSRTMSSGQPHFVAMTGTLAAMASIIVIQKPSVRLGRTNIRAFLYSRTNGSPSILPRKWKYSSNPSRETFFRYSASEYPYPTSRNSTLDRRRKSSSSSRRILTASISTSSPLVHSNLPTNNIPKRSSGRLLTRSNSSALTPLGITTGALALGYRKKLDQTVISAS